MSLKVTPNHSVKTNEVMKFRWALQCLQEAQANLVTFGITNTGKQTKQSVLANLIYLKDGNIEVDVWCGLRATVIEDSVK